MADPIEKTIYVDYLGAKCNSLRRYQYGGEETYLEIRNAATASETPIGMLNPMLGQRGPAGIFLLYRVTLQFDTSVIPEDSYILNAKLQIQFVTDLSDTDFDIVLQNGQPDYPHDPAVVADYYHGNCSGNGGSLNTSGKSTGIYYDLILNGEGKNWINIGTGAITKLYLRSSRDISSIEPTNNERISIDTYQTGRARLWVEYIPIEPASGKAIITTSVEMEISYVIMETVKAYRNSVFAKMELTGEIIKANNIFKRGFEFIIQDEEPGEEAEGTEITEESEEEYGEGEYTLDDYDIGKPLYDLEENVIFWFRAIAYIGEAKQNGDWMKNVPTMTTFECTEVGAQQAKGNGELVDLGANIVTKRGFRIIKEYTGDIFGANAYTHHGYKSQLERITTYNEKGIINGFTWSGILYRDSLHEDGGGYELGIYNKILGGGFLGEAFGLYLKPNDHYKVVAIGENQLGMGFGEEVDLNTGILILPSEDEIVSDISAEKTITLGTLPGGTTVTRIGIRLGRTMGCNEIHVYEDGEWGSGQGVTFFITDFIPGASYYKMPYIVLNHGDFEEEIKAIPDYRSPERLEEWLEDYPIEVFPEVEDEDELDQTIIDSSVGDISYRTIIKEIKCEKIGDQSFIDRYGRRRSQTVDNHLIQSRAKCIIIIDDYIDRFQILKQKYALEYDIPIPFEREDVILLGDGKTKYKDDGQGLIAFKANGEGEVFQEDFILAKIRKIDGRFISGKEAILNLELEV